MTIQSEAGSWLKENEANVDASHSGEQLGSRNSQVELRHQHMERLKTQIENTIALTDKMKRHLRKRAQRLPNQAEHISHLLDQLGPMSSLAHTLQQRAADPESTPNELLATAEQMMPIAMQLRMQAPDTLLRLRIVEIGLPLLLSVISIFLTLRYPLTEARCYEIKEALERRQGEQAT